jgi:transcriptional regulator of arginine metabolism
MEGAVATQAELRERLAQRGIEVTQATVSRDLMALNAIKTRDGYRLPGSRPESVPPSLQPTLSVVLKEFVREVRRAANLVIVKTHPGNAHTVAAALDAAGWAEVVGTVAGDDTIFVASREPREAAKLGRKIRGLLAS